MGESYSFPIIISLPNLIKGLGALAQYEFDGEGIGQHRYSPFTSISEIIEQLPKISKIIPFVEYDEEHILHCTLLKDGRYISITISPLAQRIYPFTETAEYLFVELAVLLDGMDYISVNHPSLPFLLEVLQTVEPVYGATDAWSAEPEGYWAYNNFRQDAPWHTLRGFTVFLGTPLAQVVKQFIDLDSPANGLYYVKRVSESSYFITISDKDAQPKELRRNNIDMLRKIFEILKPIPVSILSK